MKITLKQLAEAENALAILAKVTTPTSNQKYQIARLITKLQPEFAAMQPERIAIMKKYGQESDGIIRVTPEKEAECLEELGPFLAQEIEIDTRPLPFEILDNVPDFTASDINALGPFLKEPA